MQQGELLDYRGYKIFLNKCKEYHICTEKEDKTLAFLGGRNFSLAEAKKCIDDIWQEKRDEMIENEVNKLLGLAAG